MPFLVMDSADGGLHILQYCDYCELGKRIGAASFTRIERQPRWITSAHSAQMSHRVQAPHPLRREVIEGWTLCRARMTDRGDRAYRAQ